MSSNCSAGKHQQDFLIFYRDKHNVGKTLMCYLFVVPVINLLINYNFILFHSRQHVPRVSFYFMANFKNTYFRDVQSVCVKCKA